MLLDIHSPLSNSICFPVIALFFALSHAAASVGASMPIPKVRKRVQRGRKRCGERHRVKKVRNER